jgi:hypothetical protein
VRLGVARRAVHDPLEHRDGFVGASRAGEAARQRIQPLATIRMDA